MQLPLTGIRVLALEQYGAGPFATMHLADLGAEVIKIEQPGQPPGDSARQSGPYYLGENDSLFFQTFNRNKRSLSLDIGKPEGRAVFERLVATADAVINNLRGDLPGRLGLDYATLAKFNPRVVCGHLSGYGRSGPRASWPAYDYLMQAEAGYLHLTGEPEAPPTRMGLSIVDFLSGATLALAVAAGIVGALKRGRGGDVDVSLYDVAMHQLTYPATWYLNEGFETNRRPMSGHPMVVPCELFRTADGHLFIMCITPKFWRQLCECLGLSALLSDPRFVGFSERLRNRDELAAILGERLAAATTAEWMRQFAGRVPAAPVLTLSEALDNPYFREDDGVLRTAHPAKADLAMVRSPLRVDGQRLGGRAGSAYGADTDSLLEELGFDSGKRAELRSAGATQ